MASSVSGVGLRAVEGLIPPQPKSLIEVPGMEYKNIIFNAARDGKLRKLKLFLDNRHEREVSLLVSARTNGATPLVMAARNGHSEVATYLIERCRADIEQVGSVTFDGETIEGAPPLWCAAAAGHMDIVRLLVSHGANVNSTTKTNSTPLRAACFDGHFDIVEYLISNGADIEVANRHGHTCLMIACYKGHLRIASYLIDIGAELNRKTVKGNTALHDCAESGSLDIMKLLLSRNARMDVDSYGMTPLLAAAVTGHTLIVEFLIQRPEVSRTDCIDSLELLGATYVDKKRDMSGALQLWRRAMILRHSGEKPHKKPMPPAPTPAYSGAEEAQTLEDLETIRTDPDAMRMQALLVRERILGPAHPDTSYFIRYRGAVYADTGDFARCISLWMHALHMQQAILPPLSPLTQSSLLSFAELFSFMLTERSSRKLPPVEFSDLMTVLSAGICEVHSGIHAIKALPPIERDVAHMHRTLVILLHLVCLLCRLKTNLPATENWALRKCIYDWLRLSTTGRYGWTPLHLACCKDSTTVGRYPICSFPASDVIRLLCHCGADPNAKDDNGNTPLHIAAQNKPFKSSVATTLLAHGAHFDMINTDGKTFTDLVRGQENFNEVQHTTLQCLSARTIKKYHISYSSGQVPVHLRAFVDLH